MLTALRDELAREGLLVARVVTQRALGEHGADLSLAELLPGARSALVVGDGGGAFFSRFRQARPGLGREDPLDAYTAEVVPAAVARALGPQPFRVCYPFSRQPRLSVQRIGEAAGLPPAGPLGIQVHPRFGPWWAYRALVILTEAFPDEAPLGSVCDGCPAPCIGRCPAGATARAGLVVRACAEHRLRDERCHHGCAARSSCIAGPEHRYPEAQLGFHMAHSLRVIRRHLGGPA